jgi:transposase
VTPADEALFITLWQQGASQQELATRLGVPVGTIKSRASALARQGKIQARPKGGAYPHQRHQAAMAPVQTPVQSSAVHTSLHGAETVQTSAEPQISAALAEELRRLWAAIDTLQQEVHRPVHDAVHDTVQSLPEPLFDDPVDNTTERWNLYLKHGLRVRIEVLAQARGIAPSRVVQEILWQALSDVLTDLDTGKTSLA